jgi:NAD(P)-dependent dehydrogenase (short-subunit alcohol dehydrogenase family)
MKRNVLITGATSGIGYETARQLEERGYRVFATYRNPADRAKLAALPNVHPIQLDLSDPNQIAPAILQVGSAVGDNGLYAVINNAGTSYTAPIEFAQPEQARQVIEINLIAPYLVTQAAIPLLRRYNDSNAVKARIINVASWAGVMATPFIGFYNATKYGLTGLTESMYYDLRLLGIHTVLANPGVTKTPLHGKTTQGALTSLEQMPAEAQDFYRQYLEHFATMGERSDNIRGLLTAEQAAAKLTAIVDTRKPRYKYNLSVDAKLIDHIVTKLLPFRARVAMQTRMYQLNATPAPSDRATTGDHDSQRLAA